ncbi:MAG: hypothetical protein AABX05_00900 [Nanoarchaeota archaeon]
MTQKYDSEFARRHVELNRSLGISEEHTILALAQSYGKGQEMKTALAELKTGNGYRKTGKSLVDLLDEVCVPKTGLVPYNNTPKVYSFDENYLVAENLQCVDADGNVFEKYDRIYVKKDIERDEQGNPKYFTPYEAIFFMESQGMSLLSFAASCNFAAALLQHRDDPEVKPVLMQYEDYGPGYGWQTQNTLIDSREQKIIHHPHRNDFTKYVRNTSINQARQRILLPFVRTEKRKILWDRHLSDATLEKGLKDPLMFRFVRQLTGMEDPSILVEVGKYFGKTTRVWVPRSDETRAAWFGCRSGIYFNLSGYLGLGSNCAARGVRLGAQEM